MELKTFRKGIVAALVVLAAMMPAQTAAYSFKEGGIYYNVDGTQATVTYNSSSGNSYSGSVAIPETVTHGANTYRVTAIDNHAFSHSSGLTDVTIPNTIVSIGNHAFVSCTSLSNIVIPNSVQTLGRCAFHGCSALESAVIGNNVKIIDEYAFQYCYNLTKVVLGSSVDSLAIKAFFDCYKLVDVTCLATTPPGMYASYSFDDAVYHGATLSVLGSAMEAYQQHKYWKNFHRIKSLTLAEQLTLDKALITLHGGESQQLTAKVLPADASHSLKWSSEDENVATVNAEGLVSAIGSGQTVITATTTDGSNLSATCLVRVLSNGVQDNNVLTLPATFTVEKGKSYILPIGMTNKNAITAVQCDINLPEGIELAADDNGYLIDMADNRASASHGLYARLVAPRVVRVVISSPQSEVFTGNNGDLMLLHLDVNGEMEDGDYNVTLTNVILADAVGVTYFAPDVATIVTVKSYATGDANGDGTVNVGDYVAVANYILQMNPEPFIFSAADVDENGIIDVGDLVGVANIVLGDFVTPSAAPHHDDGTVTLTGESANNGEQQVVVTLNLDNEVDLTALQMNLALPEGLTLAQASLSSRAMHHSLAVNEQNDGKVRLLASSVANDLVTGHEGALLTLVLEGTASADAAVTISDVVLAEADMTTHAVNPFSISVGNSAVKEVNSDVRIYALGTDIIVETPVDTTVELIAPNGMVRVFKAKAGINTYPAERGICIVRAAGSVAKISVM